MARSNKSKPTKKSRNLLHLDLSPKPELRCHLDELAEANNMPISLAARMCIEIGIPIIKSRLEKLTQPAALPA